jgi:hypothetical protein
MRPDGVLLVFRLKSMSILTDASSSLPKGVVWGVEKRPWRLLVFGPLMVACLSRELLQLPRRKFLLRRRSRRLNRLPRLPRRVFLILTILGGAKPSLPR